MTYKMKRLVRIDVPTTFPERAEVYSLGTLKSVLENDWDSIPGFQRTRDNCWCGLTGFPLYISANSQKPRGETKAKTGLCLAINMGKGDFKEKVKSAILPILRKHWPEIEANKKSAYYWIKKGTFSQDDVDELQKVLIEEIEPELFKEGILAGTVPSADQKGAE